MLVDKAAASHLIFVSYPPAGHPGQAKGFDAYVAHFILLKSVLSIRQALSSGGSVPHCRADRGDLAKGGRGAKAQRMGWLRNLITPVDRSLPGLGLV